MIILRPNSPPRYFPPVESATPEGLLAVGGDLSSDRLLAAYQQGVFPWYSAGQPILWWSPDPRAVLYPDQLKVSRSLRQTLRRGHFEVRFDTVFRDVMLACSAPREQYPGGGTWITDEMVTAYSRLHELGYAHSIETWRGAQLTGGLYGIAIGGIFFGESMFSRETDASKVALVAMVNRLRAWDFSLIDCQVPSTHLTSLGAVNIPRHQFLMELSQALTRPGHPGRWQVKMETQTLIDREPHA
jgi:leucyl/phenylalanyl-tRNA--protein transferase